MSRAFACGCSDEARAQTESWLRLVMPGMPEGEETILTGKETPYRYEVPSSGEVHEGVIQERRPADLTEELLIALEDDCMERRESFKVSIGFDQWCGLSVETLPYANAEHEARSVFIQYDFGLLPHALAAAILMLRGTFPEESDD